MNSREAQDRYNKQTREKYKNDEVFRNRCLTKRDRQSGAWKSWQSMRSRVLSPSDTRYEKYKNYSIDPRWDSFQNFYEDMGDRPSRMTLDRINNDKGYSKENCRWASSKTQIRNRRVTKLTIEKVREIRSLIGTVSNLVLAEKYGVAPCSISNIKNERMWKEEVANV